MDPGEEADEDQTIPNQQKTHNTFTQQQNNGKPPPDTPTPASPLPTRIVEQHGTVFVSNPTFAAFLSVVAHQPEFSNSEDNGACRPARPRLTPDVLMIIQTLTMGRQRSPFRHSYPTLHAAVEIHAAGDLIEIHGEVVIDRPVLLTQPRVTLRGREGAGIRLDLMDPEGRSELEVRQERRALTRSLEHDLARHMRLFGRDHCPAGGITAGSSGMAGASVNHMEMVALEMEMMGESHIHILARLRSQYSSDALYS